MLCRTQVLQQKNEHKPSGKFYYRVELAVTFRTYQSSRET